MPARIGVKTHVLPLVFGDQADDHGGVLRDLSAEEDVVAGEKFGTELHKARVLAAPGPVEAGEGLAFIEVKLVGETFAGAGFDGEGERFLGADAGAE